MKVKFRNLKTAGVELRLIPSVLGVSDLGTQTGSVVKDGEVVNIYLDKYAKPIISCADALTGITFKGEVGQMLAATIITVKSGATELSFTTEILPDPNIVDKINAKFTGLFTLFAYAGGWTLDTYASKPTDDVKVSIEAIVPDSKYFDQWEEDNYIDAKDMDRGLNPSLSLDPVSVNFCMGRYAADISCVGATSTVNLLATMSKDKPGATLYIYDAFKAVDDPTNVILKLRGSDLGELEDFGFHAFRLMNPAYKKLVDIGDREAITLTPEGYLHSPFYIRSLEEDVRLRVEMKRDDESVPEDGAVLAMDANYPNTPTLVWEAGVLYACVHNTIEPRCHTFTPEQLDGLVNNASELKTNYLGLNRIESHHYEVNGTELKVSLEDDTLVLPENDFVTLTKDAEGAYIWAAKVSTPVTIKICSNGPVGAVPEQWTWVDAGDNNATLNYMDADGYQTAVFVLNKKAPPISCDGAINYVGMAIGYYEPNGSNSETWIPATHVRLVFNDEEHLVELDGTTPPYTLNSPLQAIFDQKVADGTLRWDKGDWDASPFEGENSFPANASTSAALRFEYELLPKNQTQFRVQFYDVNPTIDNVSKIHARVCLSPYVPIDETNAKSITEPFEMTGNWRPEVNGEINETMTTEALADSGDALLPANLYRLTPIDTTKGSSTQTFTLRGNWYIELDDVLLSHESHTIEEAIAILTDKGFDVEII